MRQNIAVIIISALGACTPAGIHSVSSGTGGGVVAGTGGSSGLGGVGTGGTPGTGGAAATDAGDGPDTSREAPVDATVREVEPDAGDGAGAVDAGDPAPTVGELEVTEVMYDCAAVVDDTGEWFEVRNTGARAWDLYRCTIGDAAHTEVVARHLIVVPGAYATLARFGDAATGGFNPDYAYATVKFSDSGDSVRVSCAGTTVDSVDFTTFPLAQGRSLSLDPRATDRALAGSWCQGGAVYNTTTRGQDHGTPGVANPPCP